MRNQLVGAACRHLLIAAIAALALLPTSSLAAGNITTDPASLELSLSKGSSATLVVTVVGPDEVSLHSLGCPHSGVVTVRHTGTIDIPPRSLIKFSVRAQTVGSCTLHFGFGMESAAVRVTVAP